MIQETDVDITGYASSPNTLFTSEKERCKALMLLVQKLIIEKDKNSVILIQSLISTQSEAIKKSFEIMADAFLKTHPC